MTQMLITIAAIGVTFMASVTDAVAQMPAQKMSADVVALEGRELRVRTAAGQLQTLKLADKVRFSGRSPGTLASITSGGFVGTTAVPQADGTLLASEVHVFPDSMRGTGEGHYPMQNIPGSTMTNATVIAIGNAHASGGSTMTNATVSDVAGANNNGRRMTLQYKGGEKIVVVPDNVPVVMVEPADRSMLVPGAHVIVYTATQPDGKLSAERVTIGKNGFVPPV